MNLLPPDAFGARSGWRLPTLSAVPIAAGCLLVAGSVFLASVEMRRLDSFRRTEAAAAAGIEARIVEFEELRERIEADRKRLEQLRVLEARLARWDEERHVLPDLLRELPLTVGDGVVLESLRRQGADFWITGRTGSTGAARTAASRFRDMDRVRSLTLQYVERGGEDSAPRYENPLGDHRFALTGTLRFNSREPAPPEALLAALSLDGTGP